MCNDPKTIEVTGKRVRGVVSSALTWDLGLHRSSRGQACCMGILAVSQ